MTTKLKVEGMHCEACVKHVTNALIEVPSVTSSQIDLKTGVAIVEHNGATLQEMSDAVEIEGYKITPLN
jgi:copper chaperone CopZ